MTTSTATLDDFIVGLCFPEAPRWHAGQLWFSDFYRHEILRADTQGQLDTIAHVDACPSGLGWRPDGTMLAVSMHDCRLLGVADGKTSTLAELGGHVPGPCNDMLVDTAGRAYIGNFGFNLYAGEPPRSTELLCVLPDGTVRVAAQDLLFPNGMALTPDGRTLIVAETFGQRLSAFDVAPDGTLARRRVFADLAGSYPDGICLDAEGAVWVADARGNRVLRVMEGRGIVEAIAINDQQCYACMLGGDDGRTLFLCTAPGTGPENGARREGRIRAARVDVPRAGLP
ncbi:SMP-30/gluconolactonase/LRE family protein [Paraburkholderia sp. J67]|uniref:SMP-30/gluconolactonase/LRE family protein n=1 Tax=Paraburkholderia sp. J67 TaxID=2805435 RepID=UPI002ABE6198|nr:SMP-30/gluconolactonase/LRE family protein [Paraburkholderia sp. J67]